MLETQPEQRCAHGRKRDAVVNKMKISLSLFTLPRLSRVQSVCVHPVCCIQLWLSVLPVLGDGVVRGDAYPVKMSRQETS